MRVKTILCRILIVRWLHQSIEFQSFFESDLQTFQEFIMGSFLTVNPGEFRNPPNPPFAILFGHRSVFASHNHLT